LNGHGLQICKEWNTKLYDNKIYLNI
jgi:hypothetical protein